jgi:hypothetical protein
MLFWLVSSSIAYAVEQFPEPSETGIAAARPSPVDAISEAELGPEPLQEPAAHQMTLAFTAGVYAVADSSDPKVASRDRDYRPRRRLFVTDERSLRTADKDADDEDGAARRLVEGELDPGLYATADQTEDCSYELWRVMRDRSTKVIAEEYLSAGRLLVSIDEVEPDWFTSAAACGDWYEWEPMPTPLVSASDGDYWVGDLQRGVWFVPKGCRWEQVVAFRGARISDVVESGAGPGSMTVDDDTFGVRLRSCRAEIRLTSAEGSEAP